MDETFGEEITKEDCQMAERVAEVAKRESDTVSMALAGTPVEDPAHSTLWIKVDLKKSLAALSRLQTKDTLPDLGTVPSAGVAIAFEKAPGDLYRITNGGVDLPLVPGHVRTRLRDFPLSDGPAVCVQPVQHPPHPGGLWHGDPPAAA